MILLIDNYDSFTFNLYQYIGTFTQDIKVVRNDKITIGEIRELHPDKIVLSPGPKSPKEAGICMDVVKEFYREIPILGICLGHQCIGEAFGGTVTYAKALFHGRQSEITHTGTGIFAGITSPVKVARYHSLAVQMDDLPVNIIRIWTDQGYFFCSPNRQYIFILQQHYRLARQFFRLLICLYRK